MKPIMADYYQKKCPICGKEFVVIWLKEWAYKRGYGKNTARYYCSWKCLRASEKKKEEEKMAGNRRNRLEVARELVGIIEKDGNVLDHLKEIGYENPQQAYFDIKNYCREKDPALWAKFPKRVKNMTKEKEPEIPEAHTIEDAAKIVNNFFGAETPEQPKIPQKPTLIYKIRSIETDFARYSVDDEYFTFQSLKNKNDNLEIPIEEAEMLATQLPAALKELGVRQ